MKHRAPPPKIEVKKKEIAQRHTLCHDVIAKLEGLKFERGGRKDAILENKSKKRSLPCRDKLLSAEKIFCQVVLLRAEVLGLDHIQVKESIRNLLNCYLALSKYQQVEELENRPREHIEKLKSNVEMPLYLWEITS